MRCDVVERGDWCGARAAGLIGGHPACARHLAIHLERLATRDRRRACAVVALLVVCALVDQVAPVARVHVTGAFFQFIIAAVIQVFAWIGSAAVTVAVTIAQAAIMIGTAIAHFAVLIAGVFARVWGFLADFWGKALRPFLDWSWKHIQALHAWLKSTFGPAIKFLESVRQQIDKFYKKWVKPIVDTIDAVRRVMQLLAQLHVPFAREIDAKLGALEQRIVAPIREVYARLNEAMNWINRIVDFNGYFQRLTLIASLMRYQRDALKVWWTSIHKPLAGAKLEEYRKPLETRTIEQVSADARAYVVLHDGPDVGRIDEHVDDLRLRLQRAQGSI
jgi:hypothetical protein